MINFVFAVPPPAVRGSFTGLAEFRLRLSRDLVRDCPYDESKKPWGKH